LSVHAVAAKGFGAEAEAYERSRPSYPADAVAWLVEALRISERSLIADVAAGTGKLTRLLMPTGARIIAVEPVAGMRSFIRDVTPLAATAEALSFRNSSLDVITVAQAFHWFDADAALTEFRRVLRPGGRVGLIWNTRDRSVSWVDAVWSIMDRVEKRAPWRDHNATGAWREAVFADNPWFTPLVEATFHHEQILTREVVVDRIRSVSHVAVLPPDQQQEVLDEVRAVLRHDPATAGRDRFALPYRVDAYWSERR
jgi:SAM-dependent methyltransferase